MGHQGKILSPFRNAFVQTLNPKQWKPVLKLEYETTWQHTQKEWRGSKMTSSNNEKKLMIGWRRCSDFLQNLLQVELQKVLVREKARHPITKHVNYISFIRMEEENIVEPNKSNVVETLEEVERDDEFENRTNNEPVRSAEKDLIGEKELIKGLVGNPRFNDSLLAMQSGKIECEAYHSLPVEPMRKAMLKKMITKKKDMG
ncbi:hypothetical protein Tco_0061818 [Tanacetum coccineum]